MPKENKQARTEWEPAVAPFRELDTILDEFAVKHGMSFEGTDLDRSSRTFRLNGPVARFIQVHLDADNDGKWYFWISAFEDRRRGRNWKGRNLRGPSRVAELRPQLIEMLAEAWEEVSAWR